MFKVALILAMVWLALVVGIKSVSADNVFLVGGRCNMVANTFSDGSVAKLAMAVHPPTNSDSIWKYDPLSGWYGWARGVPASLNTLFSIKFLDAVFVCVPAPAVLVRPGVK